MAQSGPDSDTVETTDEEPTGDPAAPADRPRASEYENDDEEWTFGLDEVGPDGAVESDPEPLEPGRPSLENTVFVLLGVVGTLLLLATVL
ncbi:hypothetical protein [Salinigranum sp.]|uniref:DUF7312 domain-containing protein n=1 Tax=Salinigranum sp. TaxID=1966351 RepID=UPI0035688D56